MFSVSIDRSLDQANWLVHTRWVESMSGPPGEDWDTSEDDESIIYHFRFEAHARLFDRVWNRTPLIFAYEMWKEFCLMALGRERLDTHWEQKGWAPAVVLVSGPLTGPMIVRGGRREYRPSLKVWFFESPADALVFWIERNG